MASVYAYALRHFKYCEGEAIEWLDTPNDRLKGKTPRQVDQEGKGEQVVALLLKMWKEDSW